MSRALRLTLIVLFIAAAAFSLLFSAWLVFDLPYDQISIVIDGERIELPEPTAGHWLVASAIVLFVLLLLMVVVPMVLVLTVTVPAALFLLALAVGALGTALALAPVLLLGLLAAWLWKRGRAAASAPAAGTTSPGATPPAA
jgi:hypothetical protein